MDGTFTRPGACHRKPPPAQKRRPVCDSMWGAPSGALVCLLLLFSAAPTPTSAYRHGPRKGALGSGSDGSRPRRAGTRRDSAVRASLELTAEAQKGLGAADAGRDGSNPLPVQTASGSRRRNVSKGTPGIPLASGAKTLSGTPMRSGTSSSFPSSPSSALSSPSTSSSPSPSSSLSSPSTSSSSSSSSSSSIGDACEGRRIFTHPLPPKFNRDLMYDPGRDTDPHAEWFTYDMLKHLEGAVHNVGFGKPIRSIMGLPALEGAWFQTDQNTLENIFYARMLSYPCRVARHEDADLVYVPYFGGHDSLRHMHKDIATRDRLAMQLVPHLRQHPAWQRANGSDHFMVLGRNLWDFRRLTTSWGSKLLELDGVYDNMWVIVVETFPGVPRVISAPKPTSFHPQSQKQLREWQEFVRSRERKWLLSFAGGHRALDTEEGVLREKLFWQCRNSRECTLVDCSLADAKWDRCQDINQFFGFYMGANFCLHPMGDACSRRSVLDAALAGCIPVVFKPCTLEDQFQWHLPRDKGRLFVHIPLEDVKGPKDLNNTKFPYLQGGEVLIENVLKAIPHAEIVAMRNRLIDIIPNLVYAGKVEGELLQAPDFKDAVDVIIDGLVSSAASGQQSLLNH